MSALGPLTLVKASVGVAVVAVLLALWLFPLCLKKQDGKKVEQAQPEASPEVTTDATDQKEATSEMAAGAPMARAGVRKRVSSPAPAQKIVVETPASVCVVAVAGAGA